MGTGGDGAFASGTGVGSDGIGPITSILLRLLSHAAY